MKFLLRNARWILVLAALGTAGAWTLAAAGGHGGEAEKAPEAPAAQGGEAGAEAAPVYKPGAPLGNYYDRSVLRAGARLSHYRYLFREVRQTVLTNSAWMIRMSCAVEFGAETGMAEIAREADMAVNDIRGALIAVPPDRLLTVAGKIALKEEIARALNRRLTTARVRQVYLTDFLISR